MRKFSFSCAVTFFFLELCLFRLNILLLFEAIERNFRLCSKFFPYFATAQHLKHCKYFHDFPFYFAIRRKSFFFNKERALFSAILKSQVYSIWQYWPLIGNVDEPTWNFISINSSPVFYWKNLLRFLCCCQSSECTLWDRNMLRTILIKSNFGL